MSFAYQTIGIVLRDSGEIIGAAAALRAGVAAARAARLPDRVADVTATLGTALVMAGRTRAGLEELDAAARASTGEVRARVLLRKATVLGFLGRHHDALADMRRALVGIRASGDQLWEARTLNNRGALHLVRGEVNRAERDALRAQELFTACDQELEVLATVQNRGAIAFCRGDLPATLALYDEAAHGCAALGVSWPELAIDRCRAFQAAGLNREAVDVVAEALAAPSLEATHRAELLFTEATAALAAGDPDTALDRARQARKMFARQERAWWEARADLVALQARHARGDGGRHLVERAGALGHRLVALRVDDAPVALLLAGRLAAAAQDPRAAHRHLAAAARYRSRESALVRATGWLAQALDRELDGDARGIFLSCNRGLDALDEYRSTLGSSELRALATEHGRDLASVALRQAVQRGESRRLLVWSERWRATALAEPPVRPPAGAAAQLAALRTRALRLDEAVNEEDAGLARRERAALEQAVRHQRHLMVGTRRRTAGFELSSLLADLGDATLLELIELDGQLHLVTVRAGRVRARSIGPVAAAQQAVAAARFVLRQTARGRPASLAGVGERLQVALLGGHVPGDGPVVVSPPSRFHATPWSLLPALATRPLSVVPSALMWQRARARTPSANGGTVLVAGPGLGTGGAEVDVLARTVPGATLLRDGTATVEASLGALDGAALAHIAAHGDFRPDSPMFSSLVLDDGPLTVHDLELLDRAPHRLVLSACDSGVSVPVGADELLGLTSALLSLGTAGVLASVAEVNDEATVPFMLSVHDRLAAGDDLPAALLAARQQAEGDGLAEATAASFLALGV